jgi:hypothetical protein
MNGSVDEYDDIRTLLRSVDPGAVPEFDATRLIARGSRSRRARRWDRWLAVAAAVLLIGGVAIGVAHLGSPVPAPQQSNSPTPVPRPTTASQYLAAAQQAVRTATSVHVVTGVGRGLIDVVVSPHYAVGTIGSNGVTSPYVADADHVFVQPLVLMAMGYLSADDVKAARGRWIDMIGASPLNQFRTSFWVAASLDDTSWPRPEGPSLSNDVGRSRASITRTVGSYNWQLDMSNAAPYRPSDLRIGDAPIAQTTFTDWDAAATPPTFPAANDVYDPSNPTP